MLSILKLAMIVWLGFLLNLGPAVSMAAEAQKTPPGETKKEATRTDRVDVNSASLKELRSIRGIDEAQARKIIEGRPYTKRRELVSKKVMDQDTYDRVRDRLAVKRTK